VKPPVLILDQQRIDAVTVALVFMDGVTRRPVRTGVAVQCWDVQRDAPRPNRLVRNLSGYMVLLNESPDQAVTFRIDATEAGYRSPGLFTVTPAVDGISHVIALEPAIDGLTEGTLVRGTVVRSGGPGSPSAPVPMGGVTVTASPEPSLAGRQFPATTDDRGAFALAVGLKPMPTEPPATVQVSLAFEKPGVPAREFAVDLAPGRLHVFSGRVDLDGHDVPPFTNPTTP
jgi:hypothetical protein